MRANFELKHGYIHLFTAQARQHPDNLAVKSGCTKLTYRELDNRSSALAIELKALGVAQEVVAAVSLERSVEMIIALLAIWKAGGAYMPLDPEYPTERLKFMLTDSRARCLITTNKLLRRFADTGPLPTLCVDDFTVQSKMGMSYGEENFDEASADQLAYVLYTSGSTGQPKGVEITQHALLSHNRAIAEAFELKRNDTVLQFATLNFDLSVEEIFPTLLCGAKLVLRPEQILSSIPEFLNFVDAERITILDLPTAYWHELVEHLAEMPLPASVRLVVIGGEKASDEAYKRWKASIPGRVRLINTYGPTEATVTALWHEAESAADALPIGRPLGETRAIILNERLEPVTRGESGELFLGGPGLARGYRNRPELTAERFITIEDERFYRTGDIVRERLDGNFEFIGRLDEQVKIRGFRVEPGEIEAALRAFSAVKDAVVLASETEPGMKRLVAYYTSRDKTAPTVTELNAFLKTRIPAYMMPSVFMGLPRFPMTPNGKVDRRALPKPSDERPSQAQELVLPRSNVEQEVAAIWREVLHLKEIGVNDNFFELGGNSLIALQIISRIRTRLKLELPLASLYEGQTIAAVATTLQSCAPSGPLAQHEADRNGDAVPASFAQEQLWLLHQLEPQSPAYNMPAAFRIKGPLNIAALGRALNAIVSRHETLRTTLKFSDRLTQVVAEKLPTRIFVSQLPASNGASELLIKDFLRRESAKPFDLEKGPLLRFNLLQIRHDEHVFLMVMHHSISDGWSLGVLFRELSEFYRVFVSEKSNADVPELPMQHADYCRWQRESMNQARLESELAWWEENLAGAPSEVSFPKLSRKQYWSGKPAATHELRFSKSMVHAVELFARRQRVTPFMLFLSALSIALNKWTGQKDLVIGTVVAGRARSEFENLIGCFMNFVPLRVEFAGARTGLDLLRKVRTAVLEGQAHQECPFAKIVAAVNPQRNGEQNPLYNVALLWQEFPADFSFQAPGLDISPMWVTPQAALLDLRFEAEQDGNEWVLKVDYNALLFEPESIASLMSLMSAELKILVRAPETALEAFATRESNERSWVDRVLHPFTATVPMTCLDWCTVLLG